LKLSGLKQPNWWTLGKGQIDLSPIDDSARRLSFGDDLQAQLCFRSSEFRIGQDTTFQYQDIYRHA